MLAKADDYTAISMNLTTHGRGGNLMVGSLTVVATPLGNPEDLGARAARALRTASVIVAEDTRTARRLLAELGMPATEERTILSCYDANEADRAAEVAERLRAGTDV